MLHAGTRAFLRPCFRPRSGAACATVPRPAVPLRTRPSATSASVADPPAGRLARVKRRLLPQTPVRRTLTALAAAAVVTVGTAGCQVFSPTATDYPYAPADGIQANVGDVAIRDLVLVVSGSGDAVVSGGLVNEGSQPVTVQFAPQQQGGSAGSGSEVRVQPYEQVDLSKQGLQLSGITAKAGALLPVSVTSNAAGTTLLNVPVVDSAGYYSTVTPAPAPSS